jgi:hypothetical protein
MKKAAVATTTARGAAVSSSRITAVQSVYMGASVEAVPSSQQMPPPVMADALQSSDGSRPCRGLRAGSLAGLLLLVLAGGGGTALANVQFENCVTAADGSITCDTVPTGNTLMNDVDARYGLLQNASPGWSEFEPYEGYDDDFGGNET